MRVCGVNEERVATAEQTGLFMDIENRKLYRIPQADRLRFAPYVQEEETTT